ncbi:MULTISPECIES: gamma-type small acid-soluble spore protein [Rossellomorea]|jgi:small acid-soluble spore protein E (minor gamma-type SASP)|uniref:Small, acid-soluble spore protein gamma-type n=1 Tax=Rossellomorea marisflavi TaxID=189381 RepID=A0A0J5TEP9_9BACI|nr:gamma-type small acid-soluble spore protein [Rossellomorea marisflavi]KML07614.1 spore protein [Rossellomorea marisflavi]KML29984.1 spore protein [Rossellomorea marisflavi]KON84397.1 spore protein [Rossellomorea marisflavi]MCM2591631.1 gamma-type small acid-soluble spore protein [Rossellomorea marisflavi]MCM2605402.1 gamma-type small acid-soluble spore protein [Rossellomorea marisflavi]
MAKKNNYNNEFASETNAQEVKKQNQQSASKAQSGQQQYGTEFASETNAAEVRKQNQQSAQKKQK